MAPSGTESDTEVEAARYRLTGFGFAVLASLGLGLAIAVARIAFEGGTDGQSIAMVRAWFVVLLVGGWCLASDRSLRVEWWVWLNCLGLGTLLAHMFFGNIGAVKYIPVGVAALLFFIYPPLVSVFTAILDRRWPGFLRFSGFLIAFGGLGVMLGVEFDDLDPLGLFFGLSAGVACAINVIWIGRVMGGRDPLVVMFHMALVAACVLTVVVLAIVGFTAPTTTAGWLGALGVVLLQGCSIPLYYAAIPRIGVETSSILNNLQPVAAIGGAFLLYGEALTSAQAIGGGMVIGGILLMQLSSKLRRMTASAD
ncbi:MAG: DMT family transporter [Alphaproteobacteria bacterium]|nr:DMT family transporter [Alphaproteobacteria bacterium]